MYTKRILMFILLATATFTLPQITSSGSWNELYDRTQQMLQNQEDSALIASNIKELRAQANKFGGKTYLNKVERLNNSLNVRRALDAGNLKEAERITKIAGMAHAPVLPEIRQELRIAKEGPRRPAMREETIPTPSIATRPVPTEEPKRVTFRQGAPEIIPAQEMTPEEQVLPTEPQKKPGKRVSFTEQLEQVRIMPEEPAMQEEPVLQPEKISPVIEHPLPFEETEKALLAAPQVPLKTPSIQEEVSEEELARRLAAVRESPEEEPTTPPLPTTPPPAKTAEEKREEELKAVAAEHMEEPQQPTVNPAEQDQKRQLKEATNALAYSIGDLTGRVAELEEIKQSAIAKIQVGKSSEVLNKVMIVEREIDTNVNQHINPHITNIDRLNSALGIAPSKEYTQLQQSFQDSHKQAQDLIREIKGIIEKETRDRELRAVAAEHGEEPQQPKPAAQPAKQAEPQGAQAAEAEEEARLKEELAQIEELQEEARLKEELQQIVALEAQVAVAEQEQALSQPPALPATPLPAMPSSVPAEPAKQAEPQGKAEAAAAEGMIPAEPEIGQTIQVKGKLESDNVITYFKPLQPSYPDDIYTLMATGKAMDKQGALWRRPLLGGSQYNYYKSSYLPDLATVTTVSFTRIDQDEFEQGYQDDAAYQRRAYPKHKFKTTESPAAVSEIIPGQGQSLITEESIFQGP